MIQDLKDHLKTEGYADWAYYNIIFYSEQDTGSRGVKELLQEYYLSDDKLKPYLMHDILSFVKTLRHIDELREIYDNKS